jgi:hypothetical protein
MDEIVRLSNRLTVPILLCECVMRLLHCVGAPVDFAFKLMLGSPQHSRVTMHFLNSIPIDQPTITHVEILNPFLGKQSDDNKLSVLDVLATDDLQIHLLQLKNLLVTANNVYHALPAERWAYFLQNADQLTSAEIRRLFPDAEIAEAAGVLEMISQTPEQLLLYNARLKFQRDEEARLRKAQQDGRSLAANRLKIGVRWRS